MAKQQSAAVASGISEAIERNAQDVATWPEVSSITNVESDVGAKQRQDARPSENGNGEPAANPWHDARGKFVKGSGRSRQSVRAARRAFAMDYVRSVDG